MKHLIPNELKDRLIWKEPRANSKDGEMHFPYVERIVPLPCDDCNQECENLRVVSSRRNIVPCVYWRSQCNICKYYYNPETGKFDLDQASLRKYWTDKNKR